MTYRDMLRFAQGRLEDAGIADAMTDAWLLFSMACKCDRTYYFMHLDEEIPADQQLEYTTLVDKRCERIPLQYIIGTQEFMGLSFVVNPNVLIPRQDTETLVEEALKRIRKGMRILDMCTGSGCILISILKKAPGVEGHGCDISKQALVVAKENARRNQVSAFFEQSNLFERVTDTYDGIVANPPYIPTAEIDRLMPEVSRFEPHLALDGKEDGLFYCRRLVEQAPQYLNRGGFLLMEIGCEQGLAVKQMMKRSGFLNISVIKDLAGNDRVVAGCL